MTKINLNTNKLSEKERYLRSYFTSLQPSIEPINGVYPVYCTDKIRFNLRMTTWDAKGVVDGFYVEEDMRKQFFYPHLPCNFLDVGVAHGSWSLPALASGANILGFEIDPRYHQTFRECLQVNPGFAGHMKLLSIGLYDQYGLGSMFEVEEVTFAPLDHVMRFVGFSPQYIKIDVEGLETKVLEGARKTIDLLRPKLFIETHYISGDTEIQKREKDVVICDFLKEYGYIPQKGRVEEWFTYLFFDNKDIK